MLCILREKKMSVSYFADVFKSLLEILIYVLLQKRY